MRYFRMEFQIKDDKGQKLNYVSDDPYKIATKAHEWVEFNYSSSEIRVNYIDYMTHNKSADELLPDELRLLIVSTALDCVDEDSTEYRVFSEYYEKVFFEYLSVWTQAPVEYCRFLDFNGYIDFKIIADF